MARSTVPVTKPADGQARLHDAKARPSYDGRGAQRLIERVALAGNRAMSQQGTVRRLPAGVVARVLRSVEVSALAGGAAPAASPSWVQRAEVPVKVTGRTHLVEIKDGSIFEGDEVAEVTHETPAITIETTDKIRSRRGPNQEYNRATDLAGRAVYRWVRVVRIGEEPVRDGIYIRDDTFTSDVEGLLGPRPSKLVGGQRERSTGGMPRQRVRLVGTQHFGGPSVDRSREVTDEELRSGTLIVEHPTPPGREGTQLDRTNLDPTQRALIERAGKLGTRIVGGDGRKLLVVGGRLHNLSIIAVDQQLRLARGVDAARIRSLTDQLINVTLGLTAGDLGEVIERVAGMGEYVHPTKAASYKPPDVSQVLRNSCRRVATITKYIKHEVLVALHRRVMQAFDADVAKGIAAKREELQGYWESYYKDRPQDEAAWQRLERDTAQQIADIPVTAFHVSLSNLTLFAETLASNRDNLVVAFGGHHVKPLLELLKEVHGIHKRYTFE